MSKKNLFKLCMVVALTISAVSAYGSGSISGNTTLGGGTYSPSNKVTVWVDSTDAGYAATSYHVNGGKSLGTNNIGTKLFWTTKTVGSSGSTPGGTTDAFGSWTSM